MPYCFWLQQDDGFVVHLLPMLMSKVTAVPGNTFSPPSSLCPPVHPAPPAEFSPGKLQLWRADRVTLLPSSSSQIRTTEFLIDCSLSLFPQWTSVRPYSMSLPVVRGTEVAAMWSSS
ncbi:hypothetical protein B0H19DRAFT_1224556 [Mycena capillaripes]|nr:hypothetical protein B0H19DRAFT_1224556 [Mycena capillaripes]